MYPQPLRSVRGGRGEQQLVDQREDDAARRGRGADGQRGREEEQRLVRQRAQRVAEVATEVFEERDAPRVPALLGDPRGRTECPNRGDARLGRIHAAGDVLGDLFVEVKLNLALQRLVHVRSANQRPHAKAYPINPSLHQRPSFLRPLTTPYDPFDVDHSASRTTRPIAFDSRSQLSSSRASCFRPAAVSV